MQRLSVASFLCLTLSLGLGQAQADGSRQRAEDVLGSRGGAAGAVAHAIGERQGAFDLEATLAERQSLHEWLMSEQLAEGLASPLTVSVGYDELQALDADPDARPVKVGLVKPLGVTISMAGVEAGQLAAPRSLAHGAIRGARDGGYVYTTAVASPGATALRLHFEDFWLPEGGELYLYTEGGQVFGPYTARGPLGSGDFWSHTVMGDRLVLQIRQHGALDAEQLAETWFVISELGHIGPRFVLGTSGSELAQFHCSYNAPCVENAECPLDPPEADAVSDAKLAVAHMQWTQGPFLYICSGGLLADTDQGSTIPYFLTANHCISRNRDANSMEAFFQLTVPCGTTSCDGIFDHQSNHPQALRTLGASILSTNSTGDYTLLELSEPAPAGSAYMGWTTTAVANSDGESLYRIAHPQGAPQAYSDHSVDTSAVTCQSWPRGSWIYSRDTFGATEGGSSGSPVVNGAGQVVGQLSGGCGYNVNDSCDAVNNATVDGAFASYYDEIEQWLDPTPSNCDPTPEVCDDGADNDCDGAVDCDDSDCDGNAACDSGGGCTAGGNGDSCTSNTDCCSGKCNRGTCRGN